MLPCYSVGLRTIKRSSLDGMENNIRACSFLNPRAGNMEWSKESLDLVGGIDLGSFNSRDQV
jgi:hypothetical protein